MTTPTRARLEDHIQSLEHLVRTLRDERDEARAQRDAVLLAGVPTITPETMEDVGAMLARAQRLVRERIERDRGFGDLKEAVSLINNARGVLVLLLAVGG